MISYFDIYTEDGELFQQLKEIIAPYIISRECRCFISVPHEEDNGYSFILRTDCFELQMALVDDFYEEFNNGTIEVTDGTNFKNIDNEMMRKSIKGEVQ